MVAENAAGAITADHLPTEASVSPSLDQVLVDSASYRAVRAQTEALSDPLSTEDMLLQSMREASPTKWHLAHTSWFFETFVLERAFVGYRSFHPEFRVLFNSYYNSVGAQWDRNRRSLSRPALDEVFRYRDHVDRMMLDWLTTIETRGAAPPGLLSVVELGLHHEQQHQELILTDIKHALAENPLRPAYAPDSIRAEKESQPISWHEHPGGLLEFGARTSPDRFVFDNETPRHRSFLEPFRLATRPITNAEFLAFMDDQGYARPELWLSDGWSVARERGWSAPLYWERHENSWFQYSLRGVEPILPDEPVTHVSFYEADAFARWRHCRLPEEREWEIIAQEARIQGNFLEDAHLHPVASSPASPTPARRGGGPVVQLFGDVWEWTRSPYTPYPGFAPATGALGEYNGKFMSGQMVLRGGSCVTPRSHIRPTYRNFFPPETRWQFSGIRLAQDAR